MLILIINFQKNFHLKILKRWKCSKLNSFKFSFSLISCETWNLQSTKQSGCLWCWAMLQLSLKTQRSCGKTSAAQGGAHQGRIMHNNVQEILSLNYDYKAPAFGDSAFVPAWRRAGERNIVQRKILARRSPADAKLYYIYIYIKFLALSPRSEWAQVKQPLGGLVCLVLICKSATTALAPSLGPQVLSHTRLVITHIVPLRV